MNYLLDTCTLSDFFKKIPATMQHFKRVSSQQMCISTISIMEIEYGLKLKKEREQKIRPIWEEVLAQVQVLPFSERCAKTTAFLRADLKLLGQLIGPSDTLIAGTAMAYNLIIVTSNLSEFKRLPILTIENWRNGSILT